MLEVEKMFEDLAGWCKANDDTGWIEETGVLGNPVKYRRKNGYVFFQTSTGTAAIPKEVKTTVFTLPEGFRPSIPEVRIGSDSSGSNVRAFSAYVKQNGEVIVFTDVYSKYFNAYGSFPVD